MLVDSGSETNLISSTMLEEIGLNINKLERTEQYNIKSSTEEVKNCILGRIQINMDLLLRSEDGNINNFARTKINFLVSSPEVELTKIILGTPFLSLNDMKMYFNMTSCKLTGNFITESGKKRVKLYTRYKEKPFLLTSNLTQISLGYNKVQFEIKNLIFETLSTQVLCDTKNELEFPSFVNLKPK